MRDRTLVLSVLIVASCGLGYELIAGALSSYLLGDSIIWWANIVFLAAYLLIKLFILVRKQRGCQIDFRKSTDNDS